MKSKERKGGANGTDMNVSIAFQQAISIGMKWMNPISRSALFWMMHPGRFLLAVSFQILILRTVNWSWIRWSIDTGVSAKIKYDLNYREIYLYSLSK